MKRHLLVLLILPNMLIAKGFNPEFDQFSGPVRRMIGEALDRYNQKSELAESRSEEKPKAVAPVSTPKSTAPVAPKDSNESGLRFALVPQKPASSATTSPATLEDSKVVSGTQSSNLPVVLNAVAVVAAGVPSAQSTQNTPAPTAGAPAAQSLQTTPVATAGVLTPKNFQFLEEPKEDKLTYRASSSSISRGQRPPVKPVVKKSPWDIFKICGCR
jgi:hypothetical protein